MKRRLGEVYWANSKLIDKTDSKTRRQYEVVKDTGKYVGVAKIRGYNDNDKNKDRLFELDIKKYPLDKRSGVDKKVYKFRSDNGKFLRLEDRQVFDEIPTFKLSSHDKHKSLVHTGMTRGNKKRKK